MSEPRLAECIPMGNVIACVGPRGIYRRRVYACPTCERRTPFVIRWDGAGYGTTEYCTVCLDGWVDGDRLERPFRRGWKKERAAHIRAMWDEAMLTAVWLEWTDRDIQRAIGGP